MVDLIQQQVRAGIEKHAAEVATDGIRSLELLVPPSVDHSDEIAVLLSGGVDSSVALKLLQLQGYKVRSYLAISELAR
jgi:asparagine synthetase B (glutamine-hydrolysing)